MNRNEEVEIDTFSSVSKIAPYDHYSINGEDLQSFSIERFERLNYPISECIFHPLLPKIAPYMIWRSGEFTRFIFWIDRSRLLVFKKHLPIHSREKELEVEFDYTFPFECADPIYFQNENIYYAPCRDKEGEYQPVMIVRVDPQGTGYTTIFVGTISKKERTDCLKLIQLSTATPGHIALMMYKIGGRPFWLIVVDSKSRIILLKEYIHEVELRSISYFANSILILKSYDEDEGINRIARFLPGEYPSAISSILMGEGMILGCDYIPHLSRLAIRGLIIKKKKRFESIHTDVINHDEIFLIVYFYNPKENEVFVEKLDGFAPIYELAGFNKFSPATWKVDKISVQMLVLSNSHRLIKLKLQSRQSEKENFTNYYYSKIINIETYEYLDSRTYLEKDWDMLYQNGDNIGIWAFNSSLATVFNRRVEHRCNLYWFEVKMPTITKIINHNSSRAHLTEDSIITVKRRVEIGAIVSSEIYNEFRIMIFREKDRIKYENKLYYPQYGLQNKSISYIKNNQRLHIDKLVCGGFVRELPVPEFLKDLPNGYVTDKMYRAELIQTINRIYQVVTSEGISFIKHQKQYPEIDKVLAKFSLVNYTNFEIKSNDFQYGAVHAGFCFDSVQGEEEDIYCLLAIENKKGQQIYKKIGPRLELVGQADIDHVKKIIQIEVDRALLHTQSGEIILAFIDQNVTLENIVNPGKRCEIIALGALQNSASILYCLHSNLQFTVMNFNELVNNLNSMSIIYTDIQSQFKLSMNLLNIEMLIPTTRELAGYILIFEKNRRFNQINTYVIYSELDTHFKMRIIKDLNIRPEKSQLNSAAFGVILSMELLENYLVQLVQGQHDDYFICVYKIYIDQFTGLEIRFRSCNSLPSFFKIDNNPSFGFYRDFGPNNPDYKNYLTLVVQSSYGAGKNILLIDPQSSSISRIRTFILPSFSTDNSIQISILGMSRGVPSMTSGFIMFPSKGSEYINNLLIMPRFGTVGIDIEKYSVFRRYHNRILDLQSSIQNIPRKDQIKAAFINDIEFNFLKTRISENILTIDIDQLLMESESFNASPKKDVVTTLVVDDSRVKYTDDRIYEINRDTETNIFSMEIKQEYSDFTLDENIKEEIFNFGISSGRPFKILELCSKTEIDEGMLYCIDPQYLLDDGKQLIDAQMMNKNRSGILDSVTYNQDCSRPFSVYKRLMLICNVEGDRFLEIIDSDSLRNKNIKLPEITDGDVSNYTIESYMLRHFTIFSVRIYNNNRIGSVALYSLLNSNHLDIQRTELKFIGKTTLRVDNLFWTISNTEIAGIRGWVDKFILQRLDIGTYSNKVILINTYVGYYNAELYDFSIDQQLPEYEYAYTWDKNFDSFMRVGSKMINMRRDCPSNIKDIDTILNFNPQGDSFLLLWSENSRLVSNFRNGRRIRLSNPFIGLQIKLTVDPICRQWLCVFVHVFSGNSYISLYYLNKSRIDLLDIAFPYSNQTPAGGPSPHYNFKDANEDNIQILDALRRNYTIYTFKVINETGLEFKQVFWDTNSSLSSSQLSFYAVSTENITKKYTIGSSSFIRFKNIYGKLNEKNVALIMRDSKGRNISKQLSVINLRDRNVLSTNIMSLFCLLCCATLIVLGIALFLQFERRTGSGNESISN